MIFNMKEKIIRNQSKTICIALVCCFLLATRCFADALPDLGSPNQSFYNQQEIKKLSKRYMQEIRQSPNYLHDPLLKDYLQNLGNTLVQHSDAPQQSFHFFILLTPEVNAFAGPGGYIGVNSGLILATRNESELAAVMAHEIAHVSQNHMLRSMTQEKRWRLPLLAAAIAAAALGYTHPALAEGAALAGFGGYIQHSIAFSRENERDADRIGIQTLHHSGFDPDSMANFFKKIQTQNHLSSLNTVPVILRAHPLNDERIADAENRTAQYAKQTYRSSSMYYLMQARMRVLASRNIQKTIHYFQRQPTTFANQYGLALAYSVAQSYPDAEKILQPLVTKFPDNIVYILADVQVDVALKKNQQALNKLDTAYENFPDSRPVLLAYANTLIKLVKNQKATQILQRAVDNSPRDFTLWQMLSIAEDKSGHKALAYFALAKSFLLRDDTDTARGYLKQALKHTKAGSLLALQIKAALSENERLP